MSNTSMKIVVLLVASTTVMASYNRGLIDNKIHPNHKISENRVKTRGYGQLKKIDRLEQRLEKLEEREDALQEEIEDIEYYKTVEELEARGMLVEYGERHQQILMSPSPEADFEEKLNFIQERNARMLVHATKKLHIVEAKIFKIEEKLEDAKKNQRSKELNDLMDESESIRGHGRPYGI